MGEFPIQYAEQTISGRGTSVRSNIDVRTGAGAVAEAVSGLGETVTDLGLKYDLKEANTQFSKYKSEVGKLDVMRDAEVRNAADSDEIKAIYEKYEKQKESLKPTNRRASQAADIWDNQQAPETMASMFEARKDKTIDNERTRILELEQEVYADPSKLPEFEKELARSITLDKNAPDDTGPTFKNEEAAKILARTRNGAALAAKNIAVESIKPNLIIAISKSGNKEDGYKVLNAATRQLIKDGILTPAEGAEANKVLGDWMDNYVAGRIKTAKDAAKLTTRQTYQQLIPQLLDNETAQQRYDMVDQSKLLKVDKEKWRGYVKGSYKDAPTKNTPEGHDTSFNAVYDAATLENSPQESYDVLLKERFINHSITDEQFGWAIDKIENPYPKVVLENLNSVIQANTEAFHDRWYSKKEKARDVKVNEALIDWVDGAIKEGKLSVYDTKLRNQLEAMSEKFRWGLHSYYNIGDIIESGGRMLEVVGFYEDGEPEVEEWWGPIAQ